MQNTIATEIIQLISAEQAWKYNVVPKSKTSNSFAFYVGSVVPAFVTEELEVLFGLNIIFDQIELADFNALLSTYYRKQDKTDNFSFSNAGDVAFIHKLIEEAHNYQASDIHLEVFEEKCRIRFRVDGKLIERYVLDKNDYPVIINKIKIEANLDIAEKRLPQDGRIFYKSNNRLHDYNSQDLELSSRGQKEEKFDVRVSALPTLHGEKIVMRLLAKNAEQINLSRLGLTEKQYLQYTSSIKKTHGIILISGPTGSGKTTTLYSTLKELNKNTRNIVTVEDPIEYTLEGINQVQVNEAIGMDYTTALRSFLRQDPDIIMLGEIRDAETAQMAIRSALTGHLVFSTIHTNSAWGTISRLIDMGVPSYLLSNTLVASVAQRLLRTLCPHCKTEKAFNSDMLPLVQDIPAIKNVSVPVGCEHCYYTGYKGRKAIYELIPVDKEISQFIKNNQTDIDSLILEREITTLSEAAYKLLQEGVTSVEEVYPIVMSV